MKTDEIKFVGMDLLNDVEKETINKLSTEYFDRIKRALNNLTEMIVITKIYGDTGKPDKRKKYDIHIKASSPNHIFTSTRAADWDIARTMHKACNECLAQIEHKLHTHDQRPKGLPRYPQRRRSHK